MNGHSFPVGSNWEESTGRASSGSWPRQASSGSGPQSDFKINEIELSAGRRRLLQHYWYNFPLLHMLKGGPEPLEKEIHKILGSKCEDRFLDPFVYLVQNTSLVRFSYLLRPCNFCKALRDMQKAIKRLRTISAAVRHWRNFSLKRLRTRSCHE